MYVTYRLSVYTCIISIGDAAIERESSRDGYRHQRKRMPWDYAVLVAARTTASGIINDNANFSYRKQIFGSARGSLRQGESASFWVKPENRDMGGRLCIYMYKLVYMQVNGWPGEMRLFFYLLGTVQTAYRTPPSLNYLIDLSSNLLYFEASSLVHLPWLGIMFLSSF